MLKSPAEDHPTHGFRQWLHYKDMGFHKKARTYSHLRDLDKITETEPNQTRCLCSFQSGHSKANNTDRRRNSNPTCRSKPAWLGSIHPLCRCHRKPKSECQFCPATYPQRLEMQRCHSGLSEPVRIAADRIKPGLHQREYTSWASVQPPRRSQEHFRWEKPSRDVSFMSWSGAACTDKHDRQAYDRKGGEGTTWFNQMNHLQCWKYSLLRCATVLQNMSAGQDYIICSAVAPLPVEWGTFIGRNVSCGISVEINFFSAFLTDGSLTSKNFCKDWAPF